MAHGKHQDAQDITIAARRVRALALRKAGASYRQIAEAQSCALGTAVADVHAALAELNAQQQADAAELRVLEAERLDALQMGLWQRATSGDVAAALAVLRIMERRARLFGLDLQPGALLPGDLEIILRWSNGRDIIDVTPPATDYHAAELAPQPDDGSDPSGAVQGAGSGPAVGQVVARLSVMPDHRVE